MTMQISEITGNIPHLKPQVQIFIDLESEIYVYYSV